MIPGAAEAPSDAARKAIFEILLALSLCHFLNDALTSQLKPPNRGSLVPSLIQHFFTYEKVTK